MSYDYAIKNVNGILAHLSGSFGQIAKSFKMKKKRNKSQKVTKVIVPRLASTLKKMLFIAHNLKVLHYVVKANTSGNRF